LEGVFLMDKRKFNFFNFVFKIIQFIFLLPINIIKYFCVGFYNVCYFFINTILNTVIFFSFCLYKILKYFILFFTFPLMIYNFFHYKGQEKKVEQNVIQSDNNSIYNDGSVIEPIINIAEMLEQSSINNTTIHKKDAVETKEEKKLEHNIKVKKQKKHPNYFMHLLMLLSFPIYKIVKYILFGLATIFIIFKNLFVYASFLLYKIVKYLLYSFLTPKMIINIIERRSGRSGEYKEQLKIKRQEAKFKKQLAYQKKQEEKLRLTLEKKQRREKESEEYINENVKIEKKTFGQKMNDLLNKIFSFPSIIITKIKKTYKNSVFVKHSRNKRDISRKALLIDFEGEDAEKSDVKLVYQYIAKDPDGKIVTDYFEAFSKVEVHSFLLSEGYEVYNIKTNKWIQFVHGSSSISKEKIKNKDLIFFLNQLSTYIKSGIPLVESLKILARQYNKQKKYQKLFRMIIYDLTMGESFSSALSKQGDAFPRILINMIKASEMTGELPEVLDDMSSYFTEIDKTRKQMVTALLYPIIILVVSVVVIIFILLFVIPRFVSIYETMDAGKIPQFTLTVLAASEFLKHNVIYLLIGVVLFVLVLIYLYRNVKAFRTIMQWILMHVPVLGNVVIYNEVTIFTKTFASLLAHNVFITDSMDILNKVTNNEIYKMLILDTITNLARGEKISESFKDHWAFPVPAYEMLVTGERTGQLPEMMLKVSEYYQELHRNAVTRIKTFIEPILILFLTAIVGVIVLAIVIPMFGLYESVQSYG